MSDPLRRLLRDRFGFSDFRPGQRPLVQAVLDGRDALGVLPTGGGKTLCFQLPAAHAPGAVVVVSPLISLMGDQVARARDLGLAAASLTSAEPRPTQAEVERDLRTGRLDLLFLSPERLTAAATRRTLMTSRISLIVVDEAHCISEWGHDFRPAFRRIAEVRAIVAAPVLAVTATATPEVREDIRRVLRMRDPVHIVTSFDRPNIFWQLRACRDSLERVRGVSRLLRRAAREALDGAALVYAPTRRQVVSVRRVLAGLGHLAEAYHAGMSNDARARTQDRFLAGKTNLVVATNAFGMGIDRSDVGLVAHIGMPGSLESYYQEAGRAGRDGRPALAVGFFDRRSWRVPATFVEHSFPSAQAVARTLRRLKHLERKRGSLTGEALLRGGAKRRAALRWLLREGVLEGNPAFQGGVTDGGGSLGESSTPGSAQMREPPRAALTGRPLRLDALRRARAGALRRLAAIRSYTRGRGCRRRALLGYLGEEPHWRSCGSCDRCVSSRGLLSS